jgi:hypothetical protein
MPLEDPFAEVAEIDALPGEAMRLAATEAVN